jgi:[acyl-carrier-protein] S-malonyltransferase
MVKTAVLFPGQGSQRIGMGKSLCEGFATARRTFEEASEVLGYDLLALCTTGREDVLGQTVHAQPALLTLSVAAFRVLEEERLLGPSLGAGHSLGELSALACAGALPFRDAVRLVSLRGRAMQEAVPVGVGAMMAVFGVEPVRVQEVCARLSTPEAVVGVANYNSSTQLVLSGHKEAVRRAGEQLEALGAVTQILGVSIPSHSLLMQPAAEKLAEALAGIPVAAPRWPVVSNVTARPYAGPEDVVRNLVAQVTRPVLWHDSARQLVEQGVQRVVEVGPKTVLRDLFRMEFPRVLGFAVEGREGVEALRAAVAGQAVAMEGAVATGVDFLRRCLTLAVATRNLGAEANKLEVGIMEPYRRIQALKRAAEGGPPPDGGQVREAAELLRRILRTKRLPEQARAERFTELFRETGTQALFLDFQP